MHTPKTKKFYILPLHDHEAGSLDEIATRVYGRKYRGQQTGDMLPNDSWHYYDMTKDEVEQWCYDMEQERVDGKGHYLGSKKVPTTGEWKSFYVEGMNWFDYWLSLDISPGDSVLSGYHSSDDTEDLRGKTISELTSIRTAPTIHYVLADLIKRGELPYGHYMLHCWW